ncbi:MAG: leucine-rich repeat domain-containing protein [Prevotella sp.]|nr:leucine-rich repeat domain-containing protein [Prevotella sp.]MBQ8706292.1 leucine-rich repeat domain-containing protein [Paludibacteraceae bacterium]
MKMLEKVIKNFLYAVVALSGSVYPCNAQTTFEVKSTKYTVNGDHTVELTEGDKQIVNLQVPSTVSYEGETYTVTSIADRAYEWGNVSVVIIPGTVKTIGKNVFGYCSLTNVILNEGLEYIGDYAFSANSLTSLEIPSTVKRICRNAFSGKSSGKPTLQTLTLHEGLEVIESGAFYANAIKELEIPASVDSIIGTAFLFSSKLEKLTLHEGLVYIGDGAFNNANSVTVAQNTTLTSVTLPSTVKYIGDECFLRMPLKTINIPKSVEYIGSCFIGACPIQSVTLDPENPNFHEVDGCIYSTDNTLLMVGPMKGKTPVNVLDGCLGIWGGAFWGSEVTTVILPESVVGIDYGAFQLSALKSINLPDNISYIDEYAFAGTNITELTLPENMPFLFEATFAQCPALKTVTIPSGLIAMEQYIFQGSNNISSVTCKGATPPELPYYEYEIQKPFSCPTTTPLYVPKGAKDAYVEAGWDAFFKITEMEKGTIQIVSTTPGNADYFTANQPYQIDITFDQDVTLADETPAVFIRPEYYYYPVDFAPAAWKAELTDTRHVRITGVDKDGLPDTFQPDIERQAYVVSIPAGIVTNAAGEVNDHYYFAVYADESLVPTAIETVAAEKAKTSGVYDLSGRKVSDGKLPAAKGIYIKDGKKFIAK